MPHICFIEVTMTSLGGRKYVATQNGRNVTPDICPVAVPRASIQREADEIIVSVITYNIGEPIWEEIHRQVIDVIKDALPANTPIRVVYSSRSWLVPTTLLQTPEPLSDEIDYKPMLNFEPSYPKKKNIRRGPSEDLSWIDKKY